MCVKLLMRADTQRSFDQLIYSNVHSVAWLRTLKYPEIRTFSIKNSSRDRCKRKMTPGGSCMYVESIPPLPDKCPKSTRRAYLGKRSTGSRNNAKNGKDMIGVTGDLVVERIWRSLAQSIYFMLMKGYFNSGYYSTAKMYTTTTFVQFQ